MTQQPGSAETGEVETTREAVERIIHALPFFDGRNTDTGLFTVRNTLRALLIQRDTLRTENAQLQAQVEAMRKSQWQPIETAPRDGTLVLLEILDSNTGPGKHIALAGWNADAGEWLRDQSDEFSATWPPLRWAPCPVPDDSP